MSIRFYLERVDISKWKNDSVMIKPLETENELIYACYECILNDDQKEMVSPAWFSIGRAYLHKNHNFPCIIYNKDNHPIGFINFYNWIGGKDAYSWSYFIDVKYQGKGYGKASAILAVNILKSVNPTKSIKLATEKNNIKAHKLYESLGFHLSSERDGDDLVFIL